MANQEHISKLSCGAKVWNEWRKENRGVIPDFDGAAFSLSQRQLGPVDLQPVNLQHANFQNAFLYYGLLNQAKLCNADFRGANLSYARLESADLTAANLSGADLQHADFLNADLTAARLEDTDLTKARNLTQQQIEKARGNRETRLPEELTAPAEWLVEERTSEEPARQSSTFVNGSTDNFYHLLNISSLATEQEIRAAYRKLAKQYHPDLNPDNPQIAEQFRLLNAVYNVLSHPQKRREYDRMLAARMDNDALQAELFG